MPLCAQELYSRDLAYPLLVGGAAINPSFVRQATFVGEERDTVYPAGMFYCKDAFAGLATMDALSDREGREAFVENRNAEVREGISRRAELQAKAAKLRPVGVRSGPSADVEVPKPEFWGVKVLERIPLGELFPLIDLNTLYRLHWGAKNAKGKEWEELVTEQFEPRLERYQQEALAGGWVRPAAAYGFFPAGSAGDALVLCDPNDAGHELARFDFPRQEARDRLCLADYFRPVDTGGSDAGAGGGRVDAGGHDVIALQIVTVGEELLDRSSRLMESGDYSEGYYLHGFGVRLAEAGAEYLHRALLLGIRRLSRPPAAWDRLRSSASTGAVGYGAHGSRGSGPGTCCPDREGLAAGLVHGQLPPEAPQHLLGHALQIVVRGPSPLFPRSGVADRVGP
jgi:5-methyltetrahydrofolate--homocysteine methyltransferase